MNYQNYNCLLVINLLYSVASIYENQVGFNAVVKISVFYIITVCTISNFQKKKKMYFSSKTL